MIFNSSEPFSNSRIDLLGQLFIEAAEITSNDFLIISPYSIGDFYHTLILMPAFRARHCRAGQKIHVICNIRCLSLVKLFNNVEKAAAVDCYQHELTIEAFAQRYPLAPGFPMVPEPVMHARGVLHRLIELGRITRIEAKKLLLELDIDAPITHPMLDESQRAVVYARARAQGLDDNSVIIFNHAQTLHPCDPEIFRPLVEHFGSNVFYDATANGNGSVPWAKPLTIPLEDVPYYAELAGNVVAVRSGIVDMLSFAECNLFTIYPNSAMIRASVSSTGLVHDLQHVTQSVRNATLERLGLRTDRPEYTVFMEEGDGPETMTQRLADALDPVLRFT